MPKGPSLSRCLAVSFLRSPLVLSVPKDSEGPLGIYSRRRKTQTEKRSGLRGNDAKPMRRIALLLPLRGNDKDVAPNNNESFVLFAVSSCIAPSGIYCEKEGANVTDCLSKSSRLFPFGQRGPFGHILLYMPAFFVPRCQRQRGPFGFRPFGGPFGHI